MKQFVETLKTIQQKLVDQDADLRKHVSDMVAYHDSSQGVPVGTIISFMGTKVPAHYLACDGKIVNIADYPILANFFEDQFDTVNYFGGDGTTTFALPDLRGEFLRGSGTAARNTGGGAAVGVHQDPTRHVYKYTNSDNNLCNYLANSAATQPMYVDTALNPTTRAYGIKGSAYTAGTTNAMFTSRPTNTAILWCIKYEPDTDLSYRNHLYNEEETLVGYWEGKPLYRKVLIVPGVAIPVKNDVQQVDIPFEIDGTCVSTRMSMFGYDPKAGNWVTHEGYSYGTSHASVYYSDIHKAVVFTASKDYNVNNIRELHIIVEYTKTTTE